MLPGKLDAISPMTFCSGLQYVNSSLKELDLRNSNVEDSTLCSTEEFTRSSLCSGLHELPAEVNRGKKKLNISDVRID
ncbi:hypothetical protein AOLI_G00200010 [Acnodon oligacanthus]